MGLLFVCVKSVLRGEGRTAGGCKNKGVVIAIFRGTPKGDFPVVDAAAFVMRLGPSVGNGHVLLHGRFCFIVSFMANAEQLIFKGKHTTSLKYKT